MFTNYLYFHKFTVVIHFIWIPNSNYGHSLSFINIVHDMVIDTLDDNHCIVISFCERFTSQSQSTITQFIASHIIKNFMFCNELMQIKCNQMSSKCWIHLSIFSKIFHLGQKKTFDYINIKNFMRKHIFFMCKDLEDDIYYPVILLSKKAIYAITLLQETSSI